MAYIIVEKKRRGGKTEVVSYGKNNRTNVVPSFSSKADASRMIKASQKRNPRKTKGVKFSLRKV